MIMESEMKTTFLAGAALALLGMNAAQAADILPPIVEAPYIEAPVYEPVSVASGWYLRGDVGYSWNKLRGVDFFQGSNATYVPFASASLRGAYTVGAGVGYKATEHLRFDATLDFSGRSKFTGSTTGGCGVAANCVSTDSSSMQALSLMANAYVDIGTWGRFTPYVGAGIGGTRVAWADLRNTSCDAANPASCDPTVIHEGETNWRFSYALMAGTTIELNCALKADVGYRYRNVRGGKMFAYALNGGPGYDKGYSSHEVRGGLRYQFGGCSQVAEVPQYTPPPIYK